MADLALAHHFLVFSLAGVLAFEIGAIRSGMTRDDVLRTARVDVWYGEAMACCRSQCAGPRAIRP